jgi:hypothetical protein
VITLKVWLITASTSVDKKQNSLKVTNYNAAAELNLLHNLHTERGQLGVKPRRQGHT